MNTERMAQLALIEQVSREHDDQEPDRLRRYRIAGPETGAFLHLLINATKSRSILEIGTSNGYSTIWMGDAAETGAGSVISVDDSERQIEAESNLRSAGLLPGTVTLVAGRAQSVLESIGKHDLVFLDAERTEYVDMWAALDSTINETGFLVVDNAISHADEMQPLKELLERDAAWETWTIVVGSGLLVAQRVQSRPRH